MPGMRKDPYGRGGATIEWPSVKLPPSARRKRAAAAQAGQPARAEGISKGERPKASKVMTAAVGAGKNREE